MLREFIFDGGASTRYHTAVVHDRQTIADHSFGVAWLCNLITEDCASKNLIMAALAHDLAEHLVGDIPSPSKRALNLGAQFDAYEHQHLKAHGLHAYYAALTPEEKLVLKMADNIEGLCFCLKERRLGNRNVEIIFARFSDYVAQLFDTKSNDTMELFDTKSNDIMDRYVAQARDIVTELQDKFMEATHVR